MKTDILYILGGAIRSPTDFELVAYLVLLLLAVFAVSALLARLVNRLLTADLEKRRKKNWPMTFLIFFATLLVLYILFSWIF